MNKNKILVTLDADLKEIVPEYLERRKADVFLMREALQKKNYTVLQSMGHKIKGNAGGYGFDPLGVLGATVESAAKVQGDSQIESALDEMQEYLTNLEVNFE